MKKLSQILISLLLFNLTVNAQFARISNQMNQAYFLSAEKDIVIANNAEPELGSAEWMIIPSSSENLNLIRILNKLKGTFLDYNNEKLICTGMDGNSKSQLWELGTKDNDGFFTIKNASNLLYIHYDWSGNLDFKSYIAHNGAFWKLTDSKTSPTTSNVSEKPTNTLEKNNQSTLIIYTLPSCTRCIYAKEYLTEQNIEYIEYDVSDSAYGDQMFELVQKTGAYESGSIQMPVFVNQGKVSFNIDDLTGFMLRFKNNKGSDNQQNNTTNNLENSISKENTSSELNSTDIKIGNITIKRSEAVVAFNYLNQVRKNPSAYSSELGVDLGYVISRKEVVWNENLAKAAEAKAHDMLARNYFGHVDPEGNGMNIKIAEAGYHLIENFVSDRTSNFFESIGMGYETGTILIQALIIDEGVPSLGHRNHLLGVDDFHANCYDIGIGMATDGKSGTYASILIAKHTF